MLDIVIRTLTVMGCYYAGVITGVVLTLIVVFIAILLLLKE